MNVENMNVVEIWEKIGQKATEQSHITEGMRAIYSFEIDSGEKHHFHLIINDGTVEIKKGEIEEVSNCIFSLKEKNFKKIITGQLNATSVFMTGRLKIKGNFKDALKLEQLLKKYSL